MLIQRATRPYIPVVIELSTQEEFDTFQGLIREFRFDHVRMQKSLDMSREIGDRLGVLELGGQ